jgi:hypothetical protein
VPKERLRLDRRYGRSRRPFLNPLRSVPQAKNAEEAWKISKWYEIPGLCWKWMVEDLGAHIFHERNT